MQVPEELRYTNDHEWARLEEGQLRVGITEYAQDALGDIVFVQLPEPGATVEAATSISEIESTKSVSDVYAPVAGTVLEVNSQLTDQPQQVNDDPYGDGWLFVLAPSDPAAYGTLLDAEAYRQLTSS